MPLTMDMPGSTRHDAAEKYIRIRLPDYKKAIPALNRSGEELLFIIRESPLSASYMRW